MQLLIVLAIVPLGVAFGYAMAAVLEAPHLCSRSAQLTECCRSMPTAVLTPSGRPRLPDGEPALRAKNDAVIPITLI